MRYPYLSPNSLPSAAGWWLSLYPSAGEAGGCFVYQRPRPPVAVPGQPTQDPERARTEAGRRAKARLRRYCAANRLNRLGTLTYAPPFCLDPVQARRDAGKFFRSLRDLLGGEPFPYVWVPEWHKDRECLHLHFAVGRYVRRSLIEQAWGHGFVHIKLLGDLGVGSGQLEEARRAARYLSKYVGKAFDGTKTSKLHRFDVAQGFQPEKVRVYGRTADQALVAAIERMGGAFPDQHWNSDDNDEWHAAPAMWVSWPG